MSKVIVFATPVFFLLIALEFAWGIAKGRNTYRLQDAISSMGLGMMSQFTAVFTRLLRLGVYTAVYASVSLVPLDAAKEFWSSWVGWVLALIFYDFCYYWLHRAGHEVAVFWAAHVVHHQSQDGAAANLHRRFPRLDFLYSHGAGRRAACGVWHCGAD
jgi:alkylglycerol monooxygenase